MPKFFIQLAEADHFRKWDEADEAQRDLVFADFRAFSAAVKERGSIVGGEALMSQDTARTVRAAPRGTERTVTEGPYAETVELVGGFYVIDVADLDTAVELARLLPAEYDLEVRECLDVDVS